MLEEITLEQLSPQSFIIEKIQEISSIVSDGLAINALSGGVDSSAVTILGQGALDNRLKTVFVDTGLMRYNEPGYVINIFRTLGVPVELINAQDIFFDALRGVTDPEEKRQVITDCFYPNVFARLVRESGARFLLQGTNYIDVRETVAGVKRQHNVLEQLGIDPEEQYGYTVIEPLIQLRKPAIRAVARALDLPEEIYNRPPFPGPALATRIIGEVTPERVEIVREATLIVEEMLKHTGAFQYLAVLHEERVTGIRDGKRAYGLQLEVRCWDSEDAVTATPTRLDYNLQDSLAERLTSEVSGVVSVVYSITKKPPSTIEPI